MTKGPAPYSLAKRLTLVFALVAGVVFALVGWYLWQSLSAELQRRDDVEISGKLEQFLHLTRVIGSIKAIRANSSAFREALQSHPGVYLGIYDGQYNPVVELTNRPNETLSTIVIGQHPVHEPYACVLPGLESARCISAEQALPTGEVVRVLLIRTAADRQALLTSYQSDIWFAVAVGATLVGVLGYAIACRGLHPIESLGHQTSNIEAHNLSERLDIRGGPIEIQELALSVNRMLDRLERAFVRLSQFSSDLAHDMRTPLANVISSSQITLSRQRTSDEYEALIGSNIEECERLQRMIESMLFLARTDNAQQHLKLTDLKAATELRRLASYFQGIGDDRNVAIAVEGDTRVFADATLFRRAVSNLVSNALDYAAPGSTVSLRSSHSSDSAVITVTNSGHPIPPEQADRIFDRFYRIDTSRQGSSKNAGLGLAIVKSIMELHRGYVGVTSNESGTTFSLRFPHSASNCGVCGAEHQDGHRL